VAHIVAAAPASPQVTAHSELSVHVALQLPSHLTLQVAEPEQAIVLPSPASILQFELTVQDTSESAPILNSHFVLAAHATSLSSPPAPLHSDESLQVSVRAPVVLPLHLAALAQASSQSRSPHSALQSVPAVHVHASSAHVQPVPVHEAVSSPPHAPRSETTKPTTKSHVIRMARSYLSHCGQGPQLYTPGAHVVGAAVPQVTAHSEPSLHTTKQSPSHLTVHVVESLQAIWLLSPTSSLHIELLLQATVAESPSLKSHFELSLHATRLLSPPAPLHSDVSLQASVNAPSVSPVHFEFMLHATEQSRPPHVALQSTPSLHAHVIALHTQPVPVHATTSLLPPHAPTTKRTNPTTTSHAIRMARS